MTIKNRSFEPLAGTVFVVTMYDPPVLQGVFKGLVAARKLCKAITESPAEIRVGHFNVDGDIETTRVQGGDFFRIWSEAVL